MTRPLVRVLFPLVPFAVVLVLFEFAVTVYRKVYCPGHPASYIVPNEKFGWTHSSGVEKSLHGCVGRSFEWRSVARFNSQGLHDDEHDYARKAGFRRLLVLGDSVAEAVQVQRPQNFSDRLESLSRENGLALEVVNAGHSGFGTDNETLFFESEGARYRPDVVILAFNLQNDLAENSPSIVRRMYRGGPAHPKSGIELATDGTIQLDTSEFSKARAEWLADPWRSWPVLEWLRLRSFFVRHFSNFLRRGALPREADWPATYPAELEVYLDPPSDEWMEARTITEVLLLRLRASVEVAGSKLLVVVVPSRETVSHHDWGTLVGLFPSLSGGDWNLEMPRAWLVEFLSSNGFSFVDVTETLRRRQSETGRRGYFEVDPHPDQHGHSWIAEAVYPGLSRTLSADLRPEAQQ